MRLIAGSLLVVDMTTTIVSSAHCPSLSGVRRPPTNPPPSRRASTWRRRLRSGCIPQGCTRTPRESPRRQRGRSIRRGAVPARDSRTHRRSLRAAGGSRARARADGAPQGPAVRLRALPRDPERGDRAAVSGRTSPERSRHELGPASPSSARSVISGRSIDASTRTLESWRLESTGIGPTFGGRHRRSASTAPGIARNTCTNFGRKPRTACRGADCPSGSASRVTAREVSEPRIPSEAALIVRSPRSASRPARQSRGTRALRRRPRGHRVVSRAPSCGKAVLLDCGLFQGKRKESQEKDLRIQIPAAEIDAVVLSHAHIDHAGRQPYLAKLGYANTIFATPATRPVRDHARRLGAHTGIQEWSDGRPCDRSIESRDTIVARRDSPCRGHMGDRRAHRSAVTLASRGRIAA